VRKYRKAVAAAGLALTGVLLAGCFGDTQAKTVSENLSAEADSFNVTRRVVFVNGITDKAVLTIEGLCSINDSGTQLEVTCKVGDDAYKKHFLGRSDNMTYFAEQIDANNVDPFHYKVVLRPEALIPDFDLQTSGNTEPTFPPKPGG
jgi:hypothetical protein